MLKVCIDANVYISAVAFDGKPEKILDLALQRKFYLITGTSIVSEVSNNLINKLRIPEERVKKIINEILTVSTNYVPTGEIQHIPHAKDSLVLETAILGRADILVTGDKKDLLPLKIFNNIIIESPSIFLARLE